VSALGRELTFCPHRPSASAIFRSREVMSRRLQALRLAAQGRYRAFSAASMLR
jgi:hypothetical protein